MPTVVFEPSPDVARSEIFGPALIVRGYDDVAGAVGGAYALETGLAGYVFSSSSAAAHDVGRRLTAGEVKINGTSLPDMSDRSARASAGTRTTTCSGSSPARASSVRTSTPL